MNMHSPSTSFKADRPSRSPLGFMRLPEVLALIPVSRSSWWSGVKMGRYPAPVKLGPRTTAWRVEDIQQLIENLVEHPDVAITSSGAA